MSAGIFDVHRRGRSCARRCVRGHARYQRHRRRKAFWSTLFRLPMRRLTVNGCGAAAVAAVIALGGCGRLARVLTDAWGAAGVAVSCVATFSDRHDRDDHAVRGSVPEPIEQGSAPSRRAGSPRGKCRARFVWSRRSLTGSSAGGRRAADWRTATASTPGSPPPGPGRWWSGGLRSRRAQYDIGVRLNELGAEPHDLEIHRTRRRRSLRR